MTRIGVILGCVIGLAGPAWGEEALSPREFCMLAEEGAAERRLCESEYRRSLDLYLNYGESEGYLSRDGIFSFSRVVKDLWSWRTLVGLPPESPFLDCSEKAPKVGSSYDFRMVWDCIAARDPRAARMDSK